MNIKIKKEFKQLIPALTTEEHKQLEANCIEEGIREKILLWNEYIIDGHNRYEIAQNNNLEFQTESKSFNSEDEVKEWMILNQFGRRNLSNYQRSVLALQLEDVFKAKAQKSKAEKVSHFRNTGEVLQKSAKPNTRKELSKVAAVSHDTIAKVKKIQEKAPEEIKAKLATGEVSINAAYKEIKKEEKKEERISIIKEQIEDIESGKVPELKGLYNVISIDPAWNYEGENKNITSYDANGRRVANPYPEMSTQEIKDIKLPLLNDSVVFLWTTHKFLPDAFDILKNWNLDYKATLVWNKEKIGMGAWFRMQCEFCLVGIKGKPYWDNTTYRDIINEPRRQHSRKPDAFFDMVDKITLGRKLEYFSREKREGWDVFGNDVNKY
jgi:N6-adenosine-specific RNA methylase IME4